MKFLKQPLTRRLVTALALGLGLGLGTAQAQAPANYKAE